MKKALLIALAAVLSATISFGQSRSIYAEQTFDSFSLNGWEIMEYGQENWSISQTNRAGGTPNEMKMTYSPSFQGFSRLVTPAVNLTDVTEVSVSFRHYLDNYSGSHTIGIATTSNNGITWNEAWSAEYSSNGQYVVSQTISTPDMGHENVRFCIFYNGNSYNINNWYVDNIMFYNLEDNDAFLKDITIPSIFMSGEQEVTIKVSNISTDMISSFEASYTLGDMETVTETFDEIVINSLETGEFTFQQPIHPLPGKYSIEVNINKVNGVVDDDPTNNTLIKEINVATSKIQNIPLIEHFTSSTCDPCAQCNVSMLALEQANEGKYTYTKYPMNFPNEGDPYATADANTRRNFYGVNAIPQLFLAGENQGYGAITQDEFDALYYTDAFVDLRGNFYVDQNFLYITAEITSFIDLKNVRVFACVNEKVTYGNVSTNGETEFHHVMMKILPNAEGAPLTLGTGESAIVDYSLNTMVTNIEELEDLEVVLFIQNPISKKIYISRWLDEYTETFPIRPELQLEDHADENYILATWQPVAGLSPTGYNVYLNKELVAENTTETSYSFEVEVGNYYIVEVEALYDDKTSVKAIRYTIAGETTGMTENVSSMRVYPNPTQNQVNILANEIQSIHVYNTMGMLVDVIQTNRNNFVSVNTNKYCNGVYFFHVKSSDGSTQTTKVVINK